MTPGSFDLDLYRGDSYHWTFVLWQDKNKTIPIDLNGATVKAEIRDKPSGAAIVHLTTVVTLPNTIVMTMTPAMYADCPVEGVWDCQVTFSDLDVHTVLRGFVGVTADVTDSSGFAPLMMAMSMGSGDEPEPSPLEATLDLIRNR